MSTATIPDLWPEFRVKAEPSPSAILRHQGEKLGEKTHNAVFGEVESAQNDPNLFGHALFISAPFFRVRQRVVEAWHNLDRYPAKVILLDEHGKRTREETADDAEKFIAVLKEMLAAPYIVRLIDSLIDQSRDLDDE